MNNKRERHIPLLDVACNYNNCIWFGKRLCDRIRRNYAQIPSQFIVKAQQKVLNKVLVGTSKSYIRILEPGDEYERPLMANAGTQTASNDFSYLNKIEQKKQQSQREKELEEKIKVLEENLKAHSELLSEIHENLARTTRLLGQQQQPQQYLPPPQLYPNEVPVNSTTLQSTQSPGVTQNKTPQFNPEIVNNSTSHSTPSNSVRNPLQQVTSSSADSVKYTIIAEGTGDHNGEPIEIQLAEDDGALNLNNSADSGRSEICLAPENNVEIKTEFNTSQNSNDNIPPVSTFSEHNFIKRRKLAVDQHEVLPPNFNYFFNDQGVLTPSSGNSNYIQQNQQQYQPQYDQQQNPKKRSGNSLLETPKVENTNDNSSHMQTTSMQSLMPSPNNSTTTQCGAASTGYKTPDNVMVSIGPNNTRILAKLYDVMTWSSASVATRKLLMTIFDRQTLATHSMTGKPSPAFKDHGKPLKQMLDPNVISDIIFAVTRKCNVSEKEVRNAITTTCADENKMMKLQMNKRTPTREVNKENMLD